MLLLVKGRVFGWCRSAVCAPPFLMRCMMLLRWWMVGVGVHGVGRGGVFRGCVVAFFVGVWVGMFFCFRASGGRLGVLPLGVPWARACGWRVSWVGCWGVLGVFWGCARGGHFSRCAHRF